jgi:hypothetical protein
MKLLHMVVFLICFYSSVSFCLFNENYLSSENPLQVSILRFSKYTANNTQYVENFYEFENCDNGNVKFNSTIVFKVEALNEMVRRLKDVVKSIKHHYSETQAQCIGESWQE